MAQLMDLDKLYKNATESVPYKEINARGFTPFQFSSRMTQVNSSQMGGLIPDNPISNLQNESTSWYEMWINPEKVTITRDYIQKRQHTAAAIITYHYRPEVYKMRVEGVCGWIAINPQSESQTKTIGFSGTNSLKYYNMVAAKKIPVNPPQSGSPRVFLGRIRALAEEPMYYVDQDGLEHYNTKFIKIYTKQYPDGMICEGYFTKFEIPESGEDPQTVSYSFDYIIESMQSVEEQKSMLGMFSTSKTTARGTLSPLPGILS
jgi:hypothetical protein